MMRDVTSIPPVRASRRIAYGPDENQFIDLFEPQSGPHAETVMMIHGGFWRAKYDLHHASHLCAELSREGFTVANVEYRRVGNAGGGWPGSFHDIQNACVATQQILADAPLVVCGHSAGGHLALRLGSENRGLAGVVALSPVAVLRDAYELHLSNDAVVEFMGGTPQQRPREYDEACPSRHSLAVPATLIHGTDDDVVPISLSREYSRLRQGDSVRLVELRATGHMELVDPNDAAFSTIAGGIADLFR
jgi:acetyl esterase/lipase